MSISYMLCNVIYDIFLWIYAVSVLHLKAFQKQYIVPLVKIIAFENIFKYLTTGIAHKIKSS